MRGYVPLGFLFAALLAAGGIFSLFAKGVTSPTHFLVVLSLVALAAGLFFVIYRMNENDKDLQREMLRAGGVPQNSRLAYFNMDDGIAINTEARTFTLMQGGLYKTYPFSQFRAYRTYHQPQRNSIRGMPSVSGLFMTVQCDRRPEWHIKMLYQADQNRWAQIIEMEIIDVADAA